MRHLVERASTWLLLGILLSATAALADEKTISLDPLPKLSGRLEVFPDGSRIYLADNAQSYLIVDERGKLIDKFNFPSGSGHRELCPLPDGRFVTFNCGFDGRIILLRSDGTEQKTLVSRGASPSDLHLSTSSIVSPHGGAIDYKNRWIFALDETESSDRSPEFVRIAVFNLEGKYLNEIKIFERDKVPSDDPKNTWLEDIEVDPELRRVYVTAKRGSRLLAFSYDGRPLGEAPGRGGIAVFPDGRIAVGSADGNGIQIYSAQLAPIRKLEVALQGVDFLDDLETDVTGRLYATARDARIFFYRWSPDFSRRELIGPRHLHLVVDFPTASPTAGVGFDIKVGVQGYPKPETINDWHVFIRPSDGSDLRWRRVESTYRRESLHVTVPEKFVGLYDVAVRFGDGAIDSTDSALDPSIQKTIAFRPRNSTSSISVFSASGRKSFRQGEPIDLQIALRPEKSKKVDVELILEAGDVEIARSRVGAQPSAAVAIPTNLSRRLIPGHYTLRPRAEGFDGYPLEFDIAAASPDSPLARIVYQEFNLHPASSPQVAAMDMPERLEFIRGYAKTLSWLGFNRETDRLMLNLNGQQTGWAWRRDAVKLDLNGPGFAVPEAYNNPSLGRWETETYLDQAVRRGIGYDSQLMTHCGQVPIGAAALDPLGAVVQRAVQWMSRYPSFHGVNLHDELFFPGPGDKALDERVQKQQSKSELKRPLAQFQAMQQMYDTFAAAVRQVSPKAGLTATPMWQHPAVEGSYAPLFDRRLSETFSHYLSEGYTLPWYPAHSVDILRRPGLPAMGVFDDGHSLWDDSKGDLYLRDLLQVVSRGVQGVGSEHTNPFDEGVNSNAYRKANTLARLYGPIFAETPPLNEGAILYSRTQDFTETRRTAGTPHWERVFVLYGVGLMAGVPMNIIYEEDVTASWLLKDGKPRVPMLFLAGQTQPLPDPVREAIARFQEAGGRVFTDADSKSFPGATMLEIKTDPIGKAIERNLNGDAWWPEIQPLYEKLAATLAAAVGDLRRYPIDTDDPWVGKCQFDGGAIRYVMLVTESSPFPWGPGAVWSTGAFYDKTNLPKVVSARLPANAAAGAIYDVFEGNLVKSEVVRDRALISADLRVVPGRLYAITNEPLASPRLGVTVSGETLTCKVQMLGSSGTPIAARVPVRIVLKSGQTKAAELVRGTGADGELSLDLPMPVMGTHWNVEITELLGGQATTAEVLNKTPPPKLLQRRPDVEPRREAQLRSLLASAGSSMSLRLPDAFKLDDERKRALTEALRARGVVLNDASARRSSASGVQIIIGELPGKEKVDEILASAVDLGLFDQSVTPRVPGPGRGFFTPLFAPRKAGEHYVALVGGDAAGVNKTIDSFIDWLRTPEKTQNPTDDNKEEKPDGTSVEGKPGSVVLPPHARDLLGIRLADLTVSSDGKHLVVSADGYLKNLALIEDRGASARVLETARVGQGPALDSLYINNDGSLFGASARHVAKFGQGFHLLSAKGGTRDLFPSFGDFGGWFQHHMSVSPDGNLVLAPGSHGVVCWKRGGKDWKEIWALDFWKEFPKLDWPVSNYNERAPFFHTYIPPGADYALILYGERANIGWQGAEYACEGFLKAVSLADGRPKWTWKIPISHALIFPTLLHSPDGSKFWVMVQKGALGSETYEFFEIVDGSVRSQWSPRAVPRATAVADHTGTIAAAFKGRRVQARRADGKLILDRVWDGQPVDLAFTSDGQDLLVVDQFGYMTRISNIGTEVWRVELGSTSRLAVKGNRIYAAGRDGRLRAFSTDGQPLWTHDCTPNLLEADPWNALIASKDVAANIHTAERPPTTSTVVPDKPNLLRTGKATLKVGGTGGWQSGGNVEVQASDLVNGRTDDVSKPWLSPRELYWSSWGTRQVWAEIEFPEPSDVHSLTVHENPEFADSWPTEGLIQLWDLKSEQWRTVAHSAFMSGPTNTYELNLKGVKKMRYLPWQSYFRNFHTSEIEVR
jgi:hypothetical protein